MGKFAIHVDLLSVILLYLSDLTFKIVLRLANIFRSLIRKIINLGTHMALFMPVKTAICLVHSIVFHLFFEILSRSKRHIKRCARFTNSGSLITMLTLGYRRKRLGIGIMQLV